LKAVQFNLSNSNITKLESAQFDNKYLRQNTYDSNTTPEL